MRALFQDAALHGISPAYERQWQRLSQHSRTIQGISYDIQQQLSSPVGVCEIPPSSGPSDLEECAMHGRPTEILATWLQFQQAAHACGFPTIEQLNPSNDTSHR